MTRRRTIVFFPCHSLDDFPTWLGDSEADELLAMIEGREPLKTRSSKLGNVG